MNKYRSAMEKITVTPQMKERILTNLSRKKEARNEIKKQPYIKWIRYAGTCAACAAILCVLFLNPSIINLNWESQQIQAPKSADNSEGNIAQPGTQQTQVPGSSDNLEGSVTQPGGLQTQAPGSSGNSGEIGTQPGGLQAQAPGSSNNSGGSDTQPRGLQTQAPGSSGNSGETGTQPGRLQAQAPGSSNNSGGSDTQPRGSQTQAPGSSGNSGGAVTQAGGSPLVNTKGVDELKKAVPFELLVPEKLPSGYKIDDTSVISGELAQIIYSNGSNEITYRMAKGTDDISGDYTTYEESNVVKIGYTEVTLKGSKSLINLATWIKDDSSYSLSFSTGVEKDAVVSIIESMKKA